MKEKPQHTVEQCNKKLAALIDKLQSIDTRDPLLRVHVDDAKMLAQELSHESDFLSRDR
tara:strand:+ start:2417 stop:2593 length:177 start_codon:yes stop_codon:yes gene_type:complete